MISPVQITKRYYVKLPSECLYRVCEANRDFNSKPKLSLWLHKHSKICRIIKSKTLLTLPIPNKRYSACPQKCSAPRCHVNEQTDRETSITKISRHFQKVHIHMLWGGQRWMRRTECSRPAHTGTGRTRAASLVTSSRALPESPASQHRPGVSLVLTEGDPFHNGSQLQPSPPPPDALGWNLCPSLSSQVLSSVYACISYLLLGNQVLTGSLKQCTFMITWFLGSQS